MSHPSVAVVVRGTGSIGRQYLRILGDRIPRSRLYAWPVARHAEALIEELPGISMGDPGTPPPSGRWAWIIATDTRRHVSDAVDALARGAAVLVEKPLAPSAAEAAALGHVGGAFVSAPLRFHSALREFRRRLPSIGPVHAVRIECQSYLPDWRPGRDYRQSYSARPDEGGALRDLIHEIDYACWIFGPPAAVWARLGSMDRLSIASEESADIWWRLPTGTAVSIRLDYLTRPPRRTMVADGSLGTLAWDGLTGVVDLVLADGSSESVQAPDRPDEALARQVDALLDATAGTAGAGDLATVDDGLLALRVCDAARRSSTSGVEEAMEP